MKKLIKVFSATSLLCIALTVLSSCQKQTIEFEWTESSNLQQTEWVINRYDNTLTNISEFPSDTIFFIDAISYQINGGIARTYSLSSLDLGEEDEYQLVLKDCSSFGGDFWAWIDQFSIDEGEVNNKLFENGSDNNIVVWMERI
ncbi:MAG: hypothetical protein AB8B56_19975 [Crocinitomicaceae bacterium]